MGGGPLEITLCAYVLLRKLRLPQNTNLNYGRHPCPDRLQYDPRHAPFASVWLQYCVNVHQTYKIIHTLHHSISSRQWIINYVLWSRKYFVVI